MAPSRAIAQAGLGPGFPQTQRRKGTAVGDASPLPAPRSSQPSEASRFKTQSCPGGDKQSPAGSSRSPSLVRGGGGGSRSSHGYGITTPQGSGRKETRLWCWQTRVRAPGPPSVGPPRRHGPGLPLRGLSLLSPSGFRNSVRKARSRDSHVICLNPKGTRF